MSVSYARLCFQYVGAVALNKGLVGLSDYSEQALADAQTMSLGRRITVVDDGSPNPAAFTPQTAKAVLKDGRVMTADIYSPYGSPAAPMGRAEQLDKFNACLRFGFGAERTDVAHEIIERINRLETLDDTSQLSRLAAGKD